MVTEALEVTIFLLEWIAGIAFKDKSQTIRS
jgi:hypothetical protein